MFFSVFLLLLVKSLFLFCIKCAAELFSVATPADYFIRCSFKQFWSKLRAMKWLCSKSETCESSKFGVDGAADKAPRTTFLGNVAVMSEPGYS